jgi:hypothetical protein
MKNVKRKCECVWSKTAMLRRVAVRYETVFFEVFLSSSRDIVIRDVYLPHRHDKGRRRRKEGLTPRFKRLFPEFSTTPCAFPKLCIICTPH